MWHGDDVNVAILTLLSLHSRELHRKGEYHDLVTPAVGVM